MHNYCFCFFQNVFGHEQHAHQLITKEAYDLLKRYVGKDIPEIYNHLGSQIGYAGDGPWTTGLILSGAWREDIEDPVYQYSNYNPPTMTGWSGAMGELFSWLIKKLNDNNEYYSSVTHFWEPDNGDLLYSDIKTKVSGFPTFGIPTTMTVPNAYLKIKAYANGNWEVVGNTDWLFNYDGKKARLVSLSGESFRRFYYTNLINLFKNGNVQIRNVANANYILDVENGSDYMISPSNGIITLQLNDEVKNKIVWEILGRMCHLLQDMTVPAHVHNDAHGDDEEGIREDPYETSFGPIQWTATQVQSNVGGLFDISNIDDPIHYLMYINAQISDHFAGAGPYSTRIDNFIEGNFTTQEYNYINSLNLSSWDGPTTFTSSLTADQLTYMRNKLIPQAIRSTATLLYWFAKEADILPKPLESVTLIGNTTLWAGFTGRWSVNLEEGIEPFTYNWQIMYLSGGIELLNANIKDKLKNKKDKKIKQGEEVIINAAPGGDFWVPIGTNSPNFVKQYNPLDLRDFKLRCIVTDATNTTKTSNELYVDVVTETPPQANVKNEDDVVLSKPNQMNVENTFPKEVSLFQNYPNPFNPSTIISYQLKESGYVRITVYNSIGEEVGLLLNEFKPAGQFKATFNAGNLPSGIYFYEMRTGNFRETKKMLLLR